MSGKRNYFLKLHENFFDETRMKRIFIDAERNNINKNDIVAIYLQLQLATMNTDGLISINSYDDDMTSKLSIEFNQPADLIDSCLMILEKFELLYWADENTIQLGTNASLKAELMPLTSTERSRRFRDKKTQCNANATQCNEDATKMQRNATQCNAHYKDIDIDIDIDKDIDINNKNKKKKVVDKSTTQKEKENDFDKSVAEEEPDEPKIDFNAILEFFNSTCTKLPKIKSLSSERVRYIKARLNKFTLDDLKTVFIKANASDFLTGNNDRSWRCDFDWLIRETNFTKTLEGKYDNVISSNTPKAGFDDAPLIIE